MPKADEDFLKFLLGGDDSEAPAETAAAKSVEEHSRLRLYADKQFLMEGYRYLAEQNSDYAKIDEAGKLMLLTAPKDLRRRLGRAG